MTKVPNQENFKILSLNQQNKMFSENKSQFLLYQKVFLEKGIPSLFWTLISYWHIELGKHVPYWIKFCLQENLRKL